MSERFLGNKTNEATKVARLIFGDSAKLSVIADGYENLIIVANEKALLRFPRNEEVWLAGKAERYVLEALSTYSDMPIAKVIATSEDPAYMHLSFLAGDQLLAGQIRSATAETLQDIGRQLAEFAYKLHSRIDVDKFLPYQTIHTWSYNDYLKRVLYERNDPNQKIDELAKYYYKAWLAKKDQKKYVIHDDLHMGNLLFDVNRKLAGVLDFGAVCVGSAEQDLRQVYRLGNEALEAAAKTYEALSGESFDRELAKLWVVTQELAAYCREDKGAAHDRAAENLQFWFPGIFDLPK